MRPAQVEHIRWLPLGCASAGRDSKWRQLQASTCHSIAIPTLQTLPFRVELILIHSMILRLLYAEQQPYTTELIGSAEGRRRAYAWQPAEVVVQGQRAARRQSSDSCTKKTKCSSKAWVQDAVCGGREREPAAAAPSRLHATSPAAGQPRQLGLQQAGNPPTGHSASAVPCPTASACVSVGESQTAGQCSAPTVGCCSLKPPRVHRLFGDR